MSYDLSFHPDALKEWNKLDGSIKEQFKKIIKRRLKEPHVTSLKLNSNLNNCYKIKLRQAGYRLVYQVDDNELIILVIAVGKRNNDTIYKLASNRN